MGNLLARWRKSTTTVEILEEIDKEIARLEKFKRSNHETRKRIIGSLILYSVILYIIGCICLYLFYTPTTPLYQLLQIAPTLCFPLLIYGLKRVLHWWFVRKIVKNDSQLQDLRDQRKDILENVMETETYKKAKEILEKFDPETKKKLEEERNRQETPQPAVGTPGTDLRRRNQPMGSPPMAPRSTLGTPARSPNQSVGPTPISMQRNFNGTMRGPRPPVVLPRPLLEQNRSSMDKFFEYLMGDGLNNRYALICKNCYSHNGMALREEFEFIDYRCGYCGFFNPARKHRPNAPLLPNKNHQNKDSKITKQVERDSGNDDSPTSSKASEIAFSDHQDPAEGNDEPDTHRKLDFGTDSELPGDQTTEPITDQGDAPDLDDKASQPDNDSTENLPPETES